MTPIVKLLCPFSVAVVLATSAAYSQVDLGDSQDVPPALSSGTLQLPPLPPEPGAPPEESESATPANPTTGTGGYLGVFTTPVPESLSVHLGDKLAMGEGLLVTQVVPDSPAATAGMRRNDILVSYDGTRLLSFEQLFQLARADQPGDTVRLEVIRAAASAPVDVTLGDPPAAAAPAVQSASRRFGRPPTGPSLGPAGPVPYTSQPGPGIYEPTVISNNDIAKFLADAPLSPDMRFAIQQRGPYLMATYRVVALQYSLVAPGIIYGTAALVDPQGYRYEFEAQGTLPQIKQQLVGHLLTLP